MMNEPWHFYIWCSSLGCLDKCFVICHPSAAQKKRKNVVVICVPRRNGMFSRGSSLETWFGRRYETMCRLFLSLNNSISSCLTNSVFLQDSQMSLQGQFPSWIDQERLTAAALLKVSLKSKISCQTLQTLRNRLASRYIQSDLSSVC